MPAMREVAILEVRDLSVSYGAIAALKNVSLRVEPGQIVSLVGANGAGKSTLMRAIIGLTPPREGEIFYKSESILGVKSYRIIQKGISQSPEGRLIFADMTVHENLIIGAYSLKLSRNDLKERIEEIFSIFPILKQRDQQLGGTLSGGEQQMLAIGRALMVRPELLLLDEPSLGISPLLTEKIFEILVAVKAKGTAILLAEQNASMALEISDYGYVIELGQVVQADTGANLLVNDAVRKAYLGI
jgi:branched-chain amino acid transport system ATP-binding protein